MESSRQTAVGSRQQIPNNSQRAEVVRRFKMKRTYVAEPHVAGVGFIHRDRKTLVSQSRIRQVCIDWFRKYFGWLPTNHWHKDGFMAEAWDDHGNRIMVEQINNDDPELMEFYFGRRVATGEQQ